MCAEVIIDVDIVRCDFVYAGLSFWTVMLGIGKVPLSCLGITPTDSVVGSSGAGGARIGSRPWNQKAEIRLAWSSHQQFGLLS